tara:strand:+ start:1109 stop:1477 length:369 start_codon:yes stop_codon:yes gene_type:complete
MATNILYMSEGPTVVLERAEYDRLCAAAEGNGDAALAQAARAADAGVPTLTADVLRRVLAGDMHPLTAWRQASQMTIAVLAERAGIRPASISNIETGKIDPRYSTVRALADALGVDTDDIMP